MQGADLWRAQLRGTDLIFSAFHAKYLLNESFLDGAGMGYVDPGLTKLTDPQILSIFGGATVTLANTIESENQNQPRHGIKENLSVEKFILE